MTEQHRQELLAMGCVEPGTEEPITEAMLREAETELTHDKPKLDEMNSRERAWVLNLMRFLPETINRNEGQT